MKGQIDDQQRIAFRKQKAIYKRLGYKTESKGSEYFQELIEYLKIDNIDNSGKKLSEREAKKNILSECIELYAFDIECGRKKFYSSLLEFFNKSPKSSYETFDEYFERAEKIIVKEIVKYYNKYVIDGEIDKNSSNNYKIR